jgi:hypothetical protein
MIPRACILSIAVLAGIAALAPPALAGPHGEVVSGFYAGGRFDLHLTLDYGFELHRAGIRREQSGFPGTSPDAPTPLVKDLYFAGSRHTMVPRLTLGLLPDLAFTAALPLVLHDARSLSLDQRDTPCVFPGSSEKPTCIDRTNSSTIQDGILPETGFDASNPDGPGFASGSTIFRGPGRSGLDQVHLGLVWAAMNQQRDDTKPTWKLGAEARLAIGAPMKLDRANPSRETSVGRGLHEVRLWTSFARRFERLEPFVELWWMAPFATREGSAFESLGFGQVHSSAQQQGGTRFGVEFTAWERPAMEQRVTVNAAAHMDAFFEGRAYTEMWEVLQYAGTAGSGGPLVLDANPVQPGRQELTHPGVTQVENYMRVGGMLGATARIRPNTYVGFTFDLLFTQPHVITFSDAGLDLPTCSETITTGCETDSNNVVNAGTEEVNPGHVPLIDLVGQRYRVDEVFDYALRIEARVLF